MNFKELMTEIKKYQQVHGLKEFIVDIKRFQEKLQKLGQDIDNITLPLSAIIEILYERISLPYYAELNDRSYSSIIQNIGKYQTVEAEKKNVRNSYSICKYELYHGRRLEGYENILAYYIRQNKEVSDALLTDSLNQNKNIASLIFAIIKEHYKK